MPHHLPEIICLFAYLFIYLFFSQHSFYFQVTHYLFVWFSILAVKTMLLLYLYILNVLPGACGDYALHVGHGLCLRPLWMCSGLWVSLWTLRLLSKYFTKYYISLWAINIRLYQLHTFGVGLHAFPTRVKARKLWEFLGNNILFCSSIYCH